MDAIQIFDIKCYGIWSGIMGLGGKRRIRKDNVRLCQVEFQTGFLHPKVCNYEELVMDKFKVEWGLRARKYEEKIKSGNTDNLVREY